MLHFRSSNGFQNVFSLDVYSRVFSNTISNFGIENENTRQYTPKFNSDFNGAFYYIKLTDQITQKSFWSELYYNSSFTNYPRALQFMIYLDDTVAEYHINIPTTGLFDFEVYLSSAIVTNPSNSSIHNVVSNGMALVHNDNFKNDYYQNGQSGVEPLIIPPSISYNG